MNHARRLLRWLPLLAVCCVLVACDREVARPDVAFSACRLKGIEIALRCVDVDVPENRDRPDGRHLAIHVAVFPALSRKPESDAVFVLAGGPGQSATAVGGLVMPLFAKINRNRDIVLVDQRGTGRSNPLSCTAEMAPVRDDDAFEPTDLDARIARCAKRLGEKADLTQYTTSIAMRDLDDVRARLGYPRIDLWGASYGTRAALDYARQFPDHVRTMTLDGVAPAWQKLPISFGVDTYATWVALVAACAHDAACAARFPHFGTDLDTVLDRLAAKPVAVDLVDPVSGRPHRMTLTRTAVAQLLRTPLYVGLTASLMPAAIDRAAHGDFEGLGALGATIGGGLDEQIALGMHLSVVCAEDVAAITPADVAGAAAEAANSVVDGRPNRFATVYLDQYRQLCAHWPATPAPAAFFETLAGKPGAAIPTLLLSGGIDPATPPVHAEAVARAMTNARHLVAPNVGHGVSSQGCAPDLIERFVRTADARALDGACLAKIPRPLFFAPIVEARRGPEPAPPP